MIFMNVNKYGSAGSSRVTDDRVYNDSKGRPVGLASRIDRVTGNCEKIDPRNAPTMTPEDKRKLNSLFDNTVSNSRRNFSERK